MIKHPALDDPVGLCFGLTTGRCFTVIGLYYPHHKGCGYTGGRMESCCGSVVPKHSNNEVSVQHLNV